MSVTRFHPNYFPISYFARSPSCYFCDLTCMMSIQQYHAFSIQNPAIVRESDWYKIGLKVNSRSKGKRHFNSFRPWWASASVSLGELLFSLELIEKCPSRPKGAVFPAPICLLGMSSLHFEKKPLHTSASLTILSVAPVRYIVSCEFVGWSGCCSQQSVR